MSAPKQFNELKRPLVLHGDGEPPATVWPAGTSLSEAGWQEREVSMSELEQVEAIAKAKNITFDEAVQTAEGRKLYSEYMERQHNGQDAPAPAPSGDATTGDRLGRQFTGDAATFKGVERDINNKVRELLASEGVHAPTKAQHSDALNRLLASEPELYSEYMAAHRKATS